MILATSWSETLIINKSSANQTAVYDSAENYSVNESGLQSPRSMIWVEAVLKFGIV